MVTAARLGLVAAALAAAGCEPDIAAGVYYCGPEQACPDGLRCDGATALCAYPETAGPFTCAAGSNDAEPDDTPAEALDLGDGGCGGASASRLGCVDNAADVDLATITTGACAGPLRASVRFPLAFAPLTVELLTPAGDLLAAGEVCDDLDESGQVKVCVEAVVDDATAYQVRVRLADDAPDCGGACAFNRYQLSVF